MKRRSAFLDSQRVIGGGFTAHERQLRRALKRLTEATLHARRVCWPDLDLDEYVPPALVEEAERILEPKRKRK